MVRGGRTFTLAGSAVHIPKDLQQQHAVGKAAHPCLPMPAPLGGHRQRSGGAPPPSPATLMAAWSALPACVRGSAGTPACALLLRA